MTNAHHLPSEDELRDALRSVIDPEVGMNVVDLGLIYGLEISPQRIHVRMTMTTPACPMGSYITDQARDVIRAAAPGVDDVDIELVWDPPWDASRMSEQAKRHFGWS
jgi:metal-sulfur cluster biosynthetic enzyme